MPDPISMVAQIHQVAIVQKLDSEIDSHHARPVQHQEDGSESSSQHSEQHNHMPSYSEIEKKLQKFIAEQNQTVHFSIDEFSKRTVLQVIDNNTKEIVKQYPTDEILKVSRMIAKSQIHKGEVTDARV